MKHTCILVFVIGSIVPVSLTTISPLINSEPDSDIQEICQDLLKNVSKYQHMMLDHMANMTAQQIMITTEIETIRRTVTHLNTSISTLSTTLSTTTSRPLTTTTALEACTVADQTGDGTSRGSCREGWICQSDGACTETCKVQGQPGDSSTRGNCKEGVLCSANGGCEKGCRVNGNEIGDGTSQGNCMIEHYCQSDGFCKHRKISVTASCEGTSDTLQKRIWSPNYPSGYNINERCIWKIEGPPGRQLTLKFNEFTTEENFDKLNIRDGPYLSSATIQVLHGSLTPQEIVSTGSSLTVEFVSDNKTSKTGFEVQYFIKTYNNFHVVRNKTCTNPVGFYSTLKNAIRNCKQGPCIVYDEGCDDAGTYSLCTDVEMVENSNDSSCLHFKNDGKLGSFKGWTFYKVKVHGKMLSQKIYDTCNANGLVAPCFYYGKTGCDYSGPLCTNIFPGGNSCTRLMQEFSKSICPNESSYYKCAKLHYVFQFMQGQFSGVKHSTGSGWGINGGQITGNFYTNKFAFCAAKD